MHSLGTFFINAMSATFFVGLAGSVVVIAIAFAEDLHELFGSEESDPEPQQRQASIQR
jgi:hypothetical protein